MAPGPASRQSTTFSVDYSERVSYILKQMQLSYEQDGDHQKMNKCVIRIRVRKERRIFCRQNLNNDAIFFK